MAIYEYEVQEYFIVIAVLGWVLTFYLLLSRQPYDHVARKLISSHRLNHKAFLADDRDQGSDPKQDCGGFEDSSYHDPSRPVRKTRIERVEGLPEDHITWNEYFMSVAQLASKRSKDPSTKVGACIVNKQNKIVATGYNGMPNGVGDDQVPWRKEGEFLDTKYAYVVHAELNAILNCVLNDKAGCRLFVSLFPCNECAKSIIQSGIKHVIYLSDKHKERDSTKASKRLFTLAKVKHEQFRGRLLIN